MNSKIVDKIKKLLNLSKSANEHEAANAAALASAMMAEHQISVATLTHDDDLEEAVIGAYIIDSSNHRKVVWKGDLAFGVAASFGCKFYWTGSSPTMVGRKSDVDSVKYVHQYLVREVNRLAEDAWDMYRYREFESARAYKTSFRSGAALVIRRRLKESREENINNEKVDADILKSQAIVRVEQGDEAIAKFHKDLSKDFGKFKPAYSAGSLEGLRAGVQAGKNIRLGGGGKGLGTGAKGIGAGTKRLSD